MIQFNTIKINQLNVNKNNNNAIDNNNIINRNNNKHTYSIRMIIIFAIVEESCKFIIVQGDDNAQPQQHDYA